MIFPDTGFHSNVSQHEAVIRVGYSDLGVNRRRVEAIRSRFDTLGSPFP
jgi:uncharacterized protein (DUF1499 family)